MGLFDRDTVVALEVGKLAARLDALERAVAELSARLAVRAEAAPVQALPAQVMALIDGLARGEPALARHLEDEARRMLTFGVEEGQVLQTLYAGSLS